MANRRMLHKNISYSKQVNSLDEFAQLVFSWTIPHLDDFGRIDGDPQTLKAMVMPLSKHSIDDFEIAIQMMIEVKLVDRYGINEELVIQYINFDKYQTGLEKRTNSKYPDKPSNQDLNSDNISEIQRNSLPTEANRKKPNVTQANSTEPNDIDNTSYKAIGVLVNPKDFSPSNADETAALEIWKEFEPDNPLAFKTTYLFACRNGIKADSLYTFASEIRQDNTIKSKGAVFQKKIKDLLKGNQSNI